jgi:ABC-type nickel/cobalt efflux system permease component RcnA
MKTILYFFFALVGLICAICAIVVLSTYYLNGVQVIGLLLLALFGMAMTMIFGYALYWHVKENRLIDLAAKEQLERDWSNYIYD